MVGEGRQGVLLTLYCNGGQLLLLSGICLSVVEMVVVWQVLLVMVGSRVHGEVGKTLPRREEGIVESWKMDPQDHQRPEAGGFLGK